MLVSSQLASYLTADHPGGTADTWLAYPANLCGQYRLVVDEVQSLYGKIVTFK